MIAVGTYAEAPVALAAFPGDVLVMEPYRPVIRYLPHLGEGALVHTITHGPDLDDLAGRVGRPRVVVEALLDEPPQDPGRLDAAGPRRSRRAFARAQPPPAPRGGSRRRGAPLGRPVRRPGVAALPRDPGRAGRAPRRLPRPHVPGADRHPALARRPPGCRVTGHVLDVRHVSTGDRAGYRRKRLRAGWLLVVSGGTAQGVALEAPSGADTCGTGRSPSRKARSRPRPDPVTVPGRRSHDVVRGATAHAGQPGHVARGSTPPEVGAEVDVRVRNTTLHADHVVLE